MNTALVHRTVPGGAATSLEVARGREVRFTAAGDQANVSLLIFRAGHRTDRLNIPDTLKAQHRACIAAPMVLMSDRGLGLASVTGSSLPWHDALCGHGVTDDRHSSYAADGNAWRRNARTGLLSELHKHGRGEVDLHATVNLFSKARIDASGGLRFEPGHSHAADWVTLRSEVDLLLVLSTAPHPLNPSWQTADVDVAVTAVESAGADDPSRLFRPESARALEQAGATFA